MNGADRRGPTAGGAGVDEVADRHAWIDASAGVAGDMLLGALLDAGASIAAVRGAVDAIVPGSIRIHTTEVARAGLRARRAHVETLAPGPPRRTWAAIRALLESAALPPGTRDRALLVFGRLAAAEAAVHGIDAEDVHFHEVGALDAIADVVGVCAALEDLGVGTVSAGEVAVGSGRVRTEHGELPVPAPAVAELARGWRVRAGGPGELATPTGMALLRALAAACEDLPPMTLHTVGVGAGGRDVAGRPNVVRVLLGTRADEAARGGEAAKGGEAAGGGEAAWGSEAAEAAVLLEANVDDLDPRLWPGVLSGLLDEGADDAWLVPILMKKGRPAHTLCVLCAPDRVAALRAHVFAHTSTLGVRESPRRKVRLARCAVDVAVPGGAVSVKIGHHDGVIVQVMPEFEDVAALARRSGTPARVVLRQAVAAAQEGGLEIGSPVPHTAQERR